MLVLGLLISPNFQSYRSREALRQHLRLAVAHRDDEEGEVQRLLKLADEKITESSDLENN